MVMAANRLEISLGGTVLPLALETPKGRPPYAKIGASYARVEKNPIEEIDFSGLQEGMGYSRKRYPNTYAWGEDLDAEAGVAVPAGKLTRVALPTYSSPPLGRITAGADWEGDLWLTSGPYILRVPGGVGAVSAPGWLTNNADTTLDSLAVFNGRMYAGASLNGVVQTLSYYSVSAGWQATADIYAQYIAVVWWETQDGLGAYRIVFNPTPSIIRHAAGDPTVLGNLSADIDAGDSTYPITNLVGSPRHVYVCKTNGLHDLDGQGRNPNITPNTWGRAIDPNNGKAAAIHDGKVIAGYSQGLDMIDTGSRQRIDEPTLIQPGANLSLPNETPVFGQIPAIETSGGWVVAGFYNGKDSYICWGRDKSKTGLQTPGPFVWHGAKAVLKGEQVTYLRVSSLGGRAQLWIASWDPAGGVPVLRTQSLPKAGTAIQDWRNGGGHQFQERCKLYLPIEDFNDAHARKTLMEYTILAEDLGDDNPTAQWELFANADGAALADGTTDWRKQGTVARNGATDFGPLSGTLGGYKVGFQLVGQGTNADPPIFHGMRPRASVHRRPIPFRRFNVELSEGTPYGDGSADFRDLMKAYGALEDMQYGGPVPLVDVNGRTYLAQVQDDLQAEIGLGTNGRATLRATLNVALLRRDFDLDSGYRLDGSERFG